MYAIRSYYGILKPFKIVSRDFQKEDTVITVRGQKIGGGTVALFAGPCAVEGREMMLGIGAQVASCGASFLRGGAFKPRTSPYAFLGLGEEGLRHLAEAREATGLPVATELMDPRDIDLRITSYNVCYTKLLRLGTEIVVEGGKIQSIGEAGATRGTTVEMTNLFGNIPARLKFLKTARTEMTHLWEVFHGVAIPGERISFRMGDGRTEVSYESRITSYNVCYTKLLRLDIP